ncbi:S41 family peptidase [Sphingomonas kyeonggiensis]|uniref:C-terminal processing protease CtpA/Prc n=1 Tax=Sphingomonas kyeonggiensis TaxID=1268553 RepID=A0A7W6JW59_9SPHN|nr:S41 family peptidase [Sphingomonas kyeonggiensis]MBB4099616.1 C-terminal processing protease CtpA/Prc [Sphingomonas kyeonggiensis]
MRRTLTALIALSLAGCSGGGGSGSVSAGGGSTGTSTPTPTPTTAAGCTLRERQTWAAAQLNEWYLFPETLPTSLDPTPYSTVGAYVDALTATARSQGRDRYFTYVTSIAEENAYYNSGSSAGFGFRLYLSGNRLYSAETFEGTSALAAGIDRGTEIQAIGTTTANLQNVSDILASGGTDALTAALGPSTAGTSRVMRINDTAGGTRVVTVSKTDYTLDPVSSRYGAKIIDDGGHRVGYVNLRTFINTADSPLRAAFANFKAQGVTEVIIDLRYNGGGLVSIAELMGNLMGANRSTSDVFDYMTFRASKSAQNETAYFAPQTQSIAPTRVAFIGTSSTASASELVAAGMLPYLGTNMALVGTNTYGKPVGQIAIDKAACDDRFRIIAFALENRDHQGAYFNGLAGTVKASCRASDDIAYQLGDPREASTRAALDFIQGKSCTAISAVGGTSASARSTGETGSPSAQQLLSPKAPSVPQRDVPGLF